MKAAVAIASVCAAAWLSGCAAEPPRPAENPEEKQAAIAAAMKALHPEARIELLPRDEVEERYGRMLPIGFEEFALLRVSEDVPDKLSFPLSSRVAFMVEAGPREAALPMYPPARDVFVALTGEALAGPETHHRLRFDWASFSLGALTLGLFDLIPFPIDKIPTVGVERYQTQPSEADQERAAPRASKLARVLRPALPCDEEGRPCARVLIMPRPVDDVPVRLEIDVDVTLPGVQTVRASWEITLPAGKPFEARLAEALSAGGAAPPAAMRWTRFADRKRGGCHLDERDCGPDRRPAPPAGVAGPPAPLSPTGAPGDEALVKERLDDVVHALQRVSIVDNPLEPSRDDWGRGAWILDEPRKRVGDLAALIGWSDPRVRRLVSALDRYDAMFDRYLRHYLERRRRELPAPGEVVEVDREDLRVLDGTCNGSPEPPPRAKKQQPAADGCATLVETRRHTSATRYVGPLQSPVLVWADGRRMPASRVRAARPSPAHAHAGWTQHWLMPVGPHHHQEEGPILLMAGDGQAALRLR